jgi:prolipoprotein diacylglyceryltransferase
VEAGLAAALILAAVGVFDSTPFPGARFGLLLAAYASGRIVVGFSRAEPRRLCRLTVAQAVSVGLVAASLVWLAVAAGTA